MNVEYATRLEELWDEWTRACELMEDDDYIIMDRCETVDTLRGVLKDVCLDCALVAFDSPNIQVTNAVGYEPHESAPAPTCAFCEEDFWGMRDGSLVLFEPEYAMKRWG